MFSNEISRRQLSTIIISYLNLKSRVRILPTTFEASFHCPFHIDKTPSLFIDLVNGRYHCFSCGRGGSVESLYKEMTGESIYKVLGITNDPFSSFARKSQISFYNFDYDKVSKKEVYLNYDSSKLTPAIENMDCIHYLVNRGISVDIAEKQGLLYSEDTIINTTSFKKRLCIPIYENGILSSIEGRKLFKEDIGPKVLYPKNTAVDLLYDIDNLNKEERVYACEGLMDLFVLRSSPSFQNSTSIFGANISKRQIEQIKQFKEFVYIPDNDQAGNKTIEFLRDSGLKNIYALKLPEELNGTSIKDIGDLPKVGVTPEELLNKKLLNYIIKLN